MLPEHHAFLVVFGRCITANLRYYSKSQEDWGSQKKNKSHKMPDLIKKWFIPKQVSKERRKLNKQLSFITTQRFFKWLWKLSKASRKKKFSRSLINASISWDTKISQRHYIGLYIKQKELVIVKSNIFLIFTIFLNLLSDHCLFFCHLIKTWSKYHYFLTIPLSCPFLKHSVLSWPVWLSGLSTGLWTKRSLVWFLARATCLGCGPSQPIDVSLTRWCFSLSFSFPSLLSINK